MAGSSESSSLSLTSSPSSGILESDQNGDDFDFDDMIKNFMVKTAISNKDLANKLWPSFMESIGNDPACRPLHRKHSTILV